MFTWLFSAMAVSLLTTFGVTIALDDHTYQLFNTLLNVFTVIYLSKLDVKQRREIQPRLEHVETIASALDPRVEGGRRQHDPDPE